MKLAQTFTLAIHDPANWYEKNGQPTINWNFVDADCYMACGNDYPNPDAFYDEFNALCDIAIFSMNTQSLIVGELMVDKETA